MMKKKSYCTLLTCMLFTFSSVYSVAQEPSNSVLEQARQNVKEGRYLQAQKAYQKVLVSEPNHYEATVELINLLMTSDKLDDARDLIDEALSTSPDDHQLVLQKALVAYAKSNDEDAKAAFDKALLIKQEDYQTVSHALAFYRGLEAPVKVKELEALLIKIMIDNKQNK